jgi:hypothetical protein
MNLWRAVTPSASRGGDSGRRAPAANTSTRQGFQGPESERLPGPSRQT